MNLPAPDATDLELTEFALSFNGYSWAEGGPLELSLKLDEIAQTRPHGFFLVSEETDVDLIRAILFWEQRGTRWGEDPAAWPSFYNLARASVARIRSLER